MRALGLFLLLAPWVASAVITGCLDKNKQCIEYPPGCLGRGRNSCGFVYSSIIQGDYIEVEIWSDRGGPNYAAISYGYKEWIANEYILFCHRNFTDGEKNDQWDGSKRVTEVTKRLEVQFLESNEDFGLYCKFRHLILPLKEMMNKAGMPTVFVPRSAYPPYYYPEKWAPIGTVNLENKESEEQVEKQRWEKLMKRKKETEKLLQTSSERVKNINTKSCNEIDPEAGNLESVVLEDGTVTVRVREPSKPCSKKCDNELGRSE